MITREYWDKLTRGEQIEVISTAWAMCPDIRKENIPPWARAGLVHDAMQIGIERFRAEIKAIKGGIMTPDDELALAPGGGQSKIRARGTGTAGGLRAEFRENSGRKLKWTRNQTAAAAGQAPAGRKNSTRGSA